MYVLHLRFLENSERTNRAQTRFSSNGEAKFWVAVRVTPRGFDESNPFSCWMMIDSLPVVT